MRAISFTVPDKRFRAPFQPLVRCVVAVFTTPLSCLQTHPPSLFRGCSSQDSAFIPLFASFPLSMDLGLALRISEILYPMLSSVLRRASGAPVNMATCLPASLNIYDCSTCQTRPLLGQLNPTRQQTNPLGFG